MSSSTNRLAIFAYGSLLFRPGFHYVGRERAELHGYARSFSQASPDHRGTPESPGRVLTLVARPEAITVGAIYFVEAPHDELLLALDHRERAGYARITLEVRSGELRLPAVTWIAPPGNEHDVGELALPDLAQLMRAASGPSGRNDDYVFQLENALAELGGADELVSGLSALLRR